MAHLSEKVAVFGVASVVVITGASRGIGRAVSLKLAENVGPGSLFILTARSKNDLSETASMITKISESSSKSFEVRCIAADLGTDGSYEVIAQQFESTDPSKYGHFMLILNASILGDITKFSHEFENVAEIQQCLKVNVTSVIVLVSKFLKTFKPDASRRITVVHISSLLAVQPLKGASMYCCTKAAKNMYMKVLAEEQKEHVRVLNYAPGPVATDMLGTITEKIVDPDSRKMFEGSRAAALKPEQTAEMMMKVLREDSYETGAHIDYFDVLASN